jgi:monothiol glutaredoxin
MTRPLLDEPHIHPAIREKVAHHHQDLLQQVRATLQAHPVVVLGMAGNPFVAKARKALATAGVPFQYLEYGSYLSQWRRRNALKMWTGWPTFPMVFVRGTLVGGADDLKRLIVAGELKALLAA